MTRPGPRIGSLFSGYGGLDVATRAVLGGAVVWCSDNDPAAAKILAHNDPAVPNLGDLTVIDWAGVPPVDVLTGGFPCQDLSLAGRRRGMAGARSGLWSHMAAAVAALQPALVVAENVRGLLSAEANSDVEPCPWCVGDRSTVDMRALGAVLADLAGIGYDAAWCGLTAASVGAPHGRFRIFVVAWPAAHTPGIGRIQRRTKPAGQFWGSDAAVRGDATTADAISSGRDGWTPDQVRRPEHGTAATRSGQVDWGVFTPGVRQWEHLTGRDAPPPTNGKTLAPAFVEWMMGLPLGRVTAVPGLTRNEQLKALGNGVVPQQAAAALRWLLAAAA